MSRVKNKKIIFLKIEDYFRNDLKRRLVKNDLPIISAPQNILLTAL